MNMDRTIAKLVAGAALIIIGKSFRAIVYHAASEPFTEFDPARIGTSTDEGLMGAGFYLSTDPNIGRSHPVTLKVQVSLRNPLHVEAGSWAEFANKARLVSDALGLSSVKTGKALTRATKSAGHDGVILDASPVGYKHQEIVVFEGKAAKILGPV